MHSDAPAFWQAYERSTRQSLPGDTPISELSFVVLDTETSGLDVGKSQILSIGAVRVSNWRIAVADRLECHLSTGAVDVTDSAAIHEILPGRQVDTRPAREALSELVAFIGNDIVVGHHIAFDRSMLEKELMAFNGGYTLRNIFLDTATLAQRVFAVGPHHIPKPWSLDALCMALHIPQYQRHTAGGDAFATALVLLKLLARLEKRGVKTLRQLCQKSRRW